MKINTDKTCVILFNRRKKDFQPEVYLNNMLLNVVESVKLVGVILSSDLKWDKNVAYMCQKARKRLWMLRRIKDLGGSKEDLLLVYCLQIRVLLEQAVSAWNGSLTKKNIEHLEKIQKSAAKLILTDKYRGYNSALKLLNLPSLESRRHTLCLSFARKASKSKKFKYWFKVPVRKVPIRKNIVQPRFVIPKTRTAAMDKSPIIYLTELLNKDTK